MGQIEIPTIHGYTDFLQGLELAGFSVGGENPEGSFALASHFGPGIEWHTGIPDTDPWQWRMRVLAEPEPVLYGKVFFKKSGYITQSWLPYFLATRRQGRSFDELYADGMASNLEKRVYAMLCERGRANTFEIRRALKGAATAAKIDNAIVALQSRLFIATAGEERRRSAAGEEYGWPVSVLAPFEQLFPDCNPINPKLAEQAIRRQLYTLNPEATERAATRILYG